MEMKENIKNSFIAIVFWKSILHDHWENFNQTGRKHPWIKGFLVSYLTLRQWRHLKTCHKLVHFLTWKVINEEWFKWFFLKIWTKDWFQFWQFCSSSCYGRDNCSCERCGLSTLVLVGSSVQVSDVVCVLLFFRNDSSGERFCLCALVLVGTIAQVSDVFCLLLLW